MPFEIKTFSADNQSLPEKVSQFLDMLAKDYGIKMNGVTLYKIGDKPVHYMFDDYQDVFAIIFNDKLVVGFWRYADLDDMILKYQTPSGDVKIYSRDDDIYKMALQLYDLLYNNSMREHFSRGLETILKGDYILCHVEEKVKGCIVYMKLYFVDAKTRITILPKHYKGVKFIDRNNAVVTLYGTMLDCRDSTFKRIQLSETVSVKLPVDINSIYDTIKKKMYGKINDKPHPF